MKPRTKPQPPRFPPLPSTSEAAVLRACLDYLRIRGHFVFRVNVGAFKTENGGYVRSTDIPGVSDIIGVTKDGRGLAVECKREKGKQRPMQKAFEMNWTRCGGLYILARGIDDLEKEGL